MDRFQSENLMKAAESIGQRCLSMNFTIVPRHGQNNHVFLLKGSRGEDFVLKIFRQAQAAAKEATVIDRLRNNSVPVAKIVSASDKDGATDFPFLLMQSAGSRTVADVFISQRPESTRFAAEMGNILARVHRTPVTDLYSDFGYDPPTPRRINDDNSRIAVALSRNNILSKQQSRELKATSIPNTLGKVLCHTDFHFVQCIVEGNRVSAVVDWENACISRAEIDLTIALTYFEVYGATKERCCFFDAYSAAYGSDLESELESVLAIRKVQLAKLAFTFSSEGRIRLARRCVELL